MNDLDLRTALHRDADLVGAPPPDLIEQLVARRQYQRRRRAGLLAAVAAVAVICAGIPVMSSLATRAGGGTATRTSVTPTPPVATETAPRAPKVAATTDAPGPTTSVAPPPTPAATTTPADTSPTCLDAAGFRNALIAAGRQPSEISVNNAAPKPECAGTWAVAVLDNVSTDSNGTPHRLALTQLFRYEQGAWTPVDRWKYCQAGLVPAAIEYLPCHTD